MESHITLKEVRDFAEKSGWLLTGVEESNNGQKKYGWITPAGRVVILEFKTSEGEIMEMVAPHSVSVQLAP